MWLRSLKSMETASPRPLQEVFREGSSAGFEAVLTLSNQTMHPKLSTKASKQCTISAPVEFLLTPEIMAPREPLLSVKRMTCLCLRKLAQTLTPASIARHSSSKMGLLLPSVVIAQTSAAVSIKEKCCCTLVVLGQPHLGLQVSCFQVRRLHPSAELRPMRNLFHAGDHSENDQGPLLPEKVGYGCPELAISRQKLLRRPRLGSGCVRHRSAIFLSKALRFDRCAAWHRARALRNTVWTRVSHPADSEWCSTVKGPAHCS